MSYAKSITNQNKVHCKHTLKCKTFTSIIVKVVFSKVTSSPRYIWYKTDRSVNNFYKSILHVHKWASILFMYSSFVHFNFLYVYLWFSWCCHTEQVTMETRKQSHKIRQIKRNLTSYKYLNDDQNICKRQLTLIVHVYYHVWNIYSLK